MAHDVIAGCQARKKGFKILDPTLDGAKTMSSIYISNRARDWLGLMDQTSFPPFLIMAVGLEEYQVLTDLHRILLFADREKLHMSLERFFRRLPVEKPVIRNNYFFQTVRPGQERVRDNIDPEELAWSESTNGLENDFARGDRFAPPKNGGVATPERLRLRSERQTLRRLPNSGAIIFTIRTYLTPLEALGREGGVPGRLASSMRSWPREVGDYKGKERGTWYETVLGYLDKCHQEQQARDEIKEGSYPY
jgi:hypothetical protein